MTDDEIEYFRRAFKNLIHLHSFDAWDMTEDQWLAHWESCPDRAKKFQNTSCSTFIRVDQSKPWAVDNLDLLTGHALRNLQKQQREAGVPYRSLTKDEWIAELRG